MDRKGVLVGFLAGGWLATVLLLVLPQVGLVPAFAQGGSGVAVPPVGPAGTGTVPVGPTVNPVGGGEGVRGIVNPGGGTSDSNRRSIALSASIGGGASVVYYFDTELGRLCVYQYAPGSKGGLRLLAARSIEWDLKLESYRDLSEKTPREMREAWQKAMQTGAPKPDDGEIPTKHVNLPAGGR